MGGLIENDKIGLDPESTSFNNLTNKEKYFFTNSQKSYTDGPKEIGSGTLNNPYGLLEVFKNKTSKAIFQRFVYYNGKTYTRVYNVLSQTWTEWVSQ